MTNSRYHVMCCSGQRVNADRQTKWFVCFGIKQISIRHPHAMQRKIKNLTAVRRLPCSPAWSITSPPSWWFETYQIKCGRVPWQQCAGGLMMIGATEHGIPHPGWPLLHHTGILPDHNLIRSFVDGCLCISTIFKFNWSVSLKNKKVFIVRYFRTVWKHRCKPGCSESLSYLGSDWLWIPRKKMNKNFGRLLTDPKSYAGPKLWNIGDIFAAHLKTSSCQFTRGRLREGTGTRGDFGGETVG